MLLKKPLAFPWLASGPSSRIILFSSLANPVYQTLVPASGVWAYCSSFVLLSCSRESPPGVGVQSEAESALTLGANDSIACVFAFVRWNASKRYR